MSNYAITSPNGTRELKTVPFMEYVKRLNPHIDKINLTTQARSVLSKVGNPEQIMADSLLRPYSTFQRKFKSDYNQKPSSSQALPPLKVIPQF